MGQSTQQTQTLTAMPGTDAPAASPTPPKINKQTIQAATQPSPGIEAITQPSFNEEQKAGELKQQQAASRMELGSSIDDQIDDDEDFDISTQEEDDQAAQDELTANALLAGFRKKLRKKRAMGLAARRLALVTEPIGKGFTKGGVSILSYLITIPIALVWIALGGLVWVFSSAFRMLFTPKLNTKPKKVPRKMKTDRVKRYFKRMSGQIASGHVKAERASLKTEKTIRVFSEATVVPFFQITAILLGLLILVAIFIGIIIGICFALDGVAGTLIKPFCKAAGIG